MADTPGSWDWWGNPGDWLGGSSGSSDRIRAERIATRYAQYIAAQDWTAANNLQLAHPKIIKALKAGKYDYLPGVYQARQTGRVVAGSGPKPTRAGDIPFRRAELPVIGAPIDAARKLPGVGTLVRGGSWGLLAASAATYIPPSWIDYGKRVLATPTAPMAPGLPGGGGPWGRATGTGRIPPAPKPRRVTAPAPPPAGRNPGVATAVRPEIQPVVVTAKRKSTSTRIYAGGSLTPPKTPPKWWESLLAKLAVIPPGQIASLLTRSSQTAPRTTVNVGPFTLPPAREDPVPSPDPLTPVEPGGVSCNCPPKKPRKPRKPRSECRSGRFIERFSGIQKYQTRKVPCRASNARLS